MFDDRIVRVGIEVNGSIKYYSDLNIQVSGTKYANGIQNECDVKIMNLSKQTRDYILTQTSPFLKPHYEANPTVVIPVTSIATTSTPKAPASDTAAQVESNVRLIVEAGRVSTGASVIFIGDIISAVPSQPPDITITIKAITLNRSKGTIVSRSSGAMTSLSSISTRVASDLGVNLTFEATDKKIANYSFTGGMLKQVEEIGRAGGVNAFIDDDKLVVKNIMSSINGKSRYLDLDTGMIGIPELTEHGIKVKYLYDNVSAIGGALEIKSKLNPTANGTYIIFKLSFDIANRENQFYLLAEARKI